MSKFDQQLTKRKANVDFICDFYLCSVVAHIYSYEPCKKYQSDGGNKACLKDVATCLSHNCTDQLFRAYNFITAHWLGPSVIKTAVPGFPKFLTSIFVWIKTTNYKFSHHLDAIFYCNLLSGFTWREVVGTALRVDLSIYKQEGRYKPRFIFIL